MILGLKLLTKDGESLNSSYGRVKYPADGSWVDVPGNGAYVARTGGLTSGGYGPVGAVLECDINTRRATSAPDGVECFGRVRRVPELEAKLQADAALAKAYAAWDKATAAWDKANAASDKATAAWYKLDAAWDKANAAWDKANAAWDKANAASDKAYAAWYKLDAAWDKACAARDKAYAAWYKADAAWVKAIYPWLREQEAALGGGAGKGEGA